MEKTKMKAKTKTASRKAAAKDISAVTESIHMKLADARAEKALEVTTKWARKQIEQFCKRKRISRAAVVRWSLDATANSLKDEAHIPGMLECDVEIREGKE